MNIGSVKTVQVNVKTLLYLPFLALFLLSSCSSTVASRIEKNPHLYAKLPESHKELVNKGQIKKGMSKEAVFLAWGRPAGSSQGERADAGHFERWTYTSLEPVYSHNYYGYYGSSYYRHHGYCHGGGYGYGYGPSVHYVPRRHAIVDFKNQRVTDWQRGRYSSGASLY